MTASQTAMTNGAERLSLMTVASVVGGKQERPQTKTRTVTAIATGQHSLMTVVYALGAILLKH